jgi:hypothetical protein
MERRNACGVQQRSSKFLRNYCFRNQFVLEERESTKLKAARPLNCAGRKQINGMTQLEIDSTFYNNNKNKNERLTQRTRPITHKTGLRATKNFSHASKSK